MTGLIWPDELSVTFPDHRVKYLYLFCNGLVHESMQEVLEGKASCCCEETKSLYALIKSQTAECTSTLGHAKELTKLQTIVDQQSRYICESKAKSNSKIRLLHAQLLAAKEEAENWAK